MASPSSSKTVIDLVDSDEDSEDSDFQPSDETATKPALRQSKLDEYSRKRSVDEDLFKDTFLAEFELRAASWPDYSIEFDVGRPYNFINLRLGQVPLQVWQASINDIDEAEIKFAHTLDLRGGARQKTSDELRGECDKLLQLKWNDSGKIKDSLSTVAASSERKRMKLLDFLKRTFDCLSAMAKICTEADAGTATVKRPSVLVIACEVGLERSLILFNLIALAVALREEAIHGDHGSIDQVCDAVATNFKLRHGRLDRNAREDSVISNPAIHSTIENLLEHVRFFLVNGRTAPRQEKRRRYEARRNYRFYY